MQSHAVNKVVGSGILPRVRALSRIAFANAAASVAAGALILSLAVDAFGAPPGANPGNAPLAPTAAIATGAASATASAQGAAATPPPAASARAVQNTADGAVVPHASDGASARPPADALPPTDQAAAPKWASDGVELELESGATGAGRHDRGSGDVPREAARPSYLQYGVAFAVEIATSGAFCEDPQLNCILGSGGGIAGRAGLRTGSDWYFGGAYELTSQDPTKLYRLAILQQVRAEARRYWFRGLDTQPFIAAGLGVAGYGNEWSVSTWGVSGFVGVGVESQSKSGPVIAATVGYRPLYLQSFLDTNGQSHGPGIAHMIALEVSLEAREPL